MSSTPSTPEKHNNENNGSKASTPKSSHKHLKIQDRKNSLNDFAKELIDNTNSKLSQSGEAVKNQKIKELDGTAQEIKDKVSESEKSLTKKMQELEEAADKITSSTESHLRALESKQEGIINEIEKVYTEHFEKANSNMKQIEESQQSIVENTTKDLQNRANNVLKEMTNTYQNTMNASENASKAAFEQLLTQHVQQLTSEKAQLDNDLNITKIALNNELETYNKKLQEFSEQKYGSFVIKMKDLENAMDDSFEQKSKEHVEKLDKHKKQVEEDLKNATDEAERLKKELNTVIEVSTKQQIQSTSKIEQMKQVAQDAESKLAEAELALENKFDSLKMKIKNAAKQLKGKAKEEEQKVVEKIQAASTDFDTLSQSRIDELKSLKDEAEKMYEEAQHKCQSSIDNLTSNIDAANKMDQKLLETEKRCNSLIENLDLSVNDAIKNIEEKTTAKVQDVTEALHSLNESHLIDLESKKESIQNEMESIFNQQSKQITDQIQEIKDVKTSFETVSQTMVEEQKKLSVELSTKISEYNKLHSEVVASNKNANEDNQAYLLRLEDQMQSMSSVKEEVENILSKSKIEAENSLQSFKEQIQITTKEQEVAVDGLLQQINGAKSGTISSIETIQNGLNESAINASEQISTKVRQAEEQIQTLSNLNDNATSNAQLLDQKIESIQSSGATIVADVNSQVDNAVQRLDQKMREAEQVSRTVSTVNPYTMLTYTLLLMAIILHLFLQYFKKDMFE